ncbi:MAG TPA: patatin-like phospholipase family protein [Longimicrobiaceae bacterium]|nr:patatin-like phospholipase family protein [Longimicrobiaceae bacterium]
MSVQPLVAAAGPANADATPPAGLPEPAGAPRRAHGTLGAIALALSGGGYRAAGFHLGVLRLLERVGLLGDVVALSTVSGGTIFGAAWVKSLLDGKSFGDFAAGFAAFLRRTNVIRDALAGLASSRGHGHPSSPSLIRAAAGVYASPDFLGERRLGEVLESPALPLDEVIFNSTEFRSGVDFRFRRSANPRAMIGNGNFPVPREAAARARLADVVAASSCFPSAFEPFVFPQQFRWPADFPLPEVQTALARAGWPEGAWKAGLPLMDGGVYDNQGVGSVLLSYREAADAPLLLVCDTSPPDPDLYPPPPAGRRGFLTLGAARVAGWLVFIAAVLSAGAVAFAAWTDPDRSILWRVLVYGVPLLLSVVVAGGMLWMRGLVRQAREVLREKVQVRDAWADLQRLTVREALHMLEVRVGSLVALASSVFMKRVRQLVYGTAFTDDAFKNRLAPALIYSLTRGSSLFATHPWLRPGPGLQELARRASSVPTALWLTDDAELDTLADAGEATACFTLLKFVLRDADGRLAAGDAARADLLERLRREWAEIGRRAGDTGASLAGV